MLLEVRESWISQVATAELKERELSSISFVSQFPKKVKPSSEMLLSQFVCLTFEVRFLHLETCLNFSISE